GGARRGAARRRGQRGRQRTQRRQRQQGLDVDGLGHDRELFPVGRTDYTSRTSPSGTDAMPVRSFLFAALLFVAAPVAAQQPAIQAQMTPEEFKAAGLAKLSAEELARLNAWLGRTV